MTTEIELLNQDKLNALLAQSSNLTFSDVLTEAGYSTNISHLQIHLDSNKQINFSGCQFENVKFSGHFESSTFENVSFNGSVFQQATFAHSIFTSTQFNNCAFIDANLNGVSFINSELKTSKAWNSDFSNAAFVDSSISHSLFAKSKFENVLDYQNTIDDMHVVFSQKYHNDYAFNQASAYEIKPTVILVGDEEWHDGPYYVVDKYHGKPITINQYAPSSIDDMALTKEVRNALLDIKFNGLNAPSIAQHVLQSDQPMINAIKSYAYRIVEEADSIWIPGGPDLHPHFYGEKNTASYIWEDAGYYREILEFALAEAALALDKPIIGICHGSQLMNVYLGGTLHQHVDGQSGITPKLNIETHEGLLGSVLEEEAYGPSYHHQAVKDLAPNLEVVATYNGVIKATQSTDGSKIMLCQFHPEYEHDKSSENILKQFMSLSAEDKIRSKIIELSNVIDFGTPIDTLLADVAHTPKPTTFYGTLNDTIHYVASYMPSFVTEIFHTRNEPIMSLSAKNKMPYKNIDLSDVVSFSTPEDILLESQLAYPPAQEPKPTTFYDMVKDTAHYITSYAPSFVTELFSTHSEPVAVM